MFSLHPQLEKDTFHVTDLSLCRVLLMNNHLFPWIILVPQVEEVTEIIDLSVIDRHRLMDEIAKASQVMQAVYKPKKLNVAALGNIVPQLHVHVIARAETDAAWPNPVWGGPSEYYGDPEPAIVKLRGVFNDPG